MTSTELPNRTVKTFGQYESSEVSTRIPTSLAIHDMGLATVIGAANKDATGKPLSAHYFWALEVKDYGQSYGVQSGAIALMGVDSLVYDHVIVSSKLADATSQSSKYFTVNLTIPGFENRGYFITPKIVSASAQDVLQKLFVSYRPLKDNDKIIYKIKDRHYEGLPVSTAQARYSNTNICTWSSTTQFYTSLNRTCSHRQGQEVF